MFCYYYNVSKNGSEVIQGSTLGHGTVTERFWLGRRTTQLQHLVQGQNDHFRCKESGLQNLLTDIDINPVAVVSCWVPSIAMISMNSTTLEAASLFPLVPLRVS